MARILTTKNLPDIKAKAKEAIKTDINNNFNTFSSEDSSHTNYIPIQTVSFNVGDLSPNFVFYERQAMNNPETYHAWVSIGVPDKSNADPLVYKNGNRMQNLSDTRFWPANSNKKTFKNKKNVNITLYFHNTFGTRGEAGESPNNASNHAAEYIGETGNSDYLGNYMKFDSSTGTLTIRTTGMA